MLSALVVLAWAGAANGQGFGPIGLKSKVTLQRKLPALVHLPGTSVKLIVNGHEGMGDLASDFKTMLGSELLKDDPRLRIEDKSAESTVDCLITDFEHPPATNSTRPGPPNKKGQTSPVNYTRVTGLMRVSFKARGTHGETLGSDNVTAKYDEEFDTSGNSLSGGVLGSLKNGAKRITGGAKAEDMNPPTDAELRNKLMNSAIQQIVTQLVNTRETIEVYLAKGKAMDLGIKDAEGGLWPRALEAWEAAPPLPRPIDDAYRLYDVGVAYEALAYAADDMKTAMKYLDQASINYGKAIDDNPAEKYFVAPQKRIETALAHYEKLQHEMEKPPPPPPAPPSPPAKKTTRKKGS